MFSVFILFALFYTSVSFNTDVNIPVVRRSDQTGSYFGFSVAQHQWYNSSSSAYENWLLVGAPKANASALLAHNIVNPGAVYKCDVIRDFCKEIIFDKDGNREVDGDVLEDKSNQWFGVSLYSSGRDGTVVACAHRYLYKGQLANYHMYPGQCFSNRGNLEKERQRKVYETCKNLNDMDASKQTPGVSLASYTRYQYCQMGVSALYIPEIRTTMFGAPGSKNYQGLIFYKQSGQSKAKEIQNTTSPLGYQGFSTSYGSFFKPKQVDVVTGAPRFNHCGMVVVFERGSSTYPDYQPRKVILPTEEEGNPQPGSGFGYSVVGVDVNNDSLTDVLVGAPYYSVKGSPNEGRVFVYMNKGNGVFKKEMELAPSVKKRMAQFGHVVARVGDLDQDGYEDVAVGAPYEDMNGVLYIFNGSADGLTKKPAQIIKSSDLLQKPKTFGYSIAGRLDLDGNGYPDILVGAYESDSVFLLRSRPIIDMKAKITITPNPFDIKTKNCPVTYKGKIINTACMNIDICLGYKERKGRLKDKLSLDLTIESDVEYVHQSRTKKEARIMFAATGGPVYNKTLLSDLPVDPDKECFFEQLFLRENVKDVYPDITFKINYKMHEPTTPPTPAPGKLPSLAGYAMLEEKQKDFVTAVLKFKRDCVKCEPNLDLACDNKETLAVGAQDYKLDITISNSGESAYNTELMITVPEGVTMSHVYDASDTIKTEFLIDHLVTSERLSDNSSKLAIPIANPLKNSEIKILRVFLNTGSFSKSQDFLAINLEVMSSNKEPANLMDNNKVHLNITIVSQANLELSGSTRHEQIYYGGEVVGESAMVTEDDIGNEVRQTYIVQNLGPDLVPEAEIVINWPYEAPSGKHLLYLMEVTPVGGRGECDFLPNQINLLNLLKKTKSQASRNTTARDVSIRKRRNAQPEQEKKESKEKRQTAEKSKGPKGVVLDCSNTPCTAIKCTMKRLTKGDAVSFVIRARIWNGTLLEDYYGKEVEVVSSATVKTSVSFVKEINEKNNHAEIRTLFFPDFPPPPSKKLAAWVIPVAVVGAVLALLIIILILWKLGFFKRKTFDGNMTEAEGEAMLDSKQEKKPYDH